MVILAGELLKECKAFLEEGVHPQVGGVPELWRRGYPMHVPKTKGSQYRGTK